MGISNMCVWGGGGGCNFMGKGKRKGRVNLISQGPV